MVFVLAVYLTMILFLDFKWNIYEMYVVYVGRYHEIDFNRFNRYCGTHISF